MKVYYTPPDAPVLTGNKSFDELLQKSLNADGEVWKYKTMWILRSIENEITEEGGMIVSRPDGEIDVIGFSEHTASKIWKLLYEAKE